MRTLRYCFGALLVLTARAGAQATIDTSRTLITANGVIRQNLTPDRVTLNMLVEPQAFSVDEAVRSLGNAERAVLDTLRKLNVAASAIQVFNNGVAPFRSQMSSPMQPGPSFAGREIIRVELTRVDQVGTISSAAMAKGATFVAPPTYSASTADSVRRALLPLAFQAAQRDAETLARATGLRLGRLVSTSTNAGPTFPSIDQQTIYVSSNMFDNGQRALPSASVTVSVSVTYLLLR